MSRICGREVLESALMSGHRFQIPNGITSRQKLIICPSGVANSQLRPFSKNGTSVTMDTYWYWLMVSNTGTVRATEYNKGEHKHRGDSTYKLTVKWFVDTRAWKQVLSNDTSGRVLNGSRRSCLFPKRSMP